MIHKVEDQLDQLDELDMLERINNMPANVEPSFVKLPLGLCDM